MRSAAQAVDHVLQELVDVASSAWGCVDLLVFGDHGMVSVQRTVDIGSRVRGFEADGGLCFVDSTLLRCWHEKDGRARRFAGQLLEELEPPCSSIEIPRRYRERLGGAVLALPPGVVFHPSYFGTDTPPRGMHGYGGGEGGDETLVGSTFGPGNPPSTLGGRGSLKRVYDLAANWVETAL